MEIQAHMVLDTAFCGVINVPVLRTSGTNPWGPHVHFLASKQGQRVLRRSFMVEIIRVTSLHGACRESPQAQGATIDGLLRMVVRERWGATMMASKKPCTTSAGDGTRRVAVPCRVSRCRCWSWAEPVVHEAIDLSVREASVHHRWLKVCSFCVLALSFVGVLVATQGLRGWEVSAAVMALESAATLTVLGGTVVLVAFQFICIVGGCFRWLGLVGGGECGCVSAAEFDAEEADAFLFDGRCRADEGELRERFNVHEVMGLSLSLVHEGKRRVLYLCVGFYFYVAFVLCFCGVQYSTFGGDGAVKRLWVC